MVQLISIIKNRKMLSITYNLLMFLIIFSLKAPTFTMDSSSKVALSQSHDQSVPHQDNYHLTASSVDDHLSLFQFKQCNSISTEQECSKKGCLFCQKKCFKFFDAECLNLTIVPNIITNYTFVNAMYICEPHINKLIVDYMDRLGKSQLSQNNYDLRFSNVNMTFKWISSNVSRLTFLPELGVQNETRGQFRLTLKIGQHNVYGIDSNITYRTVQFDTIKPDYGFIDHTAQFNIIGKGLETVELSGFDIKLGKLPCSSLSRKPNFPITCIADLSGNCGDCKVNIAFRGQSVRLSDRLLTIVPIPMITDYFPKTTFMAAKFAFNFNLTNVTKPFYEPKISLTQDQKSATISSDPIDCSFNRESGLLTCPTSNVSYSANQPLTGLVNVTFFSHSQRISQKLLSSSSVYPITLTITDTPGIESIVFNESTKQYEFTIDNYNGQYPFNISMVNSVTSQSLFCESFQFVEPNKAVCNFTSSLPDYKEWCAQLAYGQWSKCFPLTLYSESVGISLLLFSGILTLIGLAFVSIIIIAAKKSWSDVVKPSSLADDPESLNKDSKGLPKRESLPSLEELKIPGKSSSNTGLKRASGTSSLTKIPSNPQLKKSSSSSLLNSVKSSDNSNADKTQSKTGLKNKKTPSTSSLSKLKKL